MPLTQTTGLNCATVQPGPESGIVVSASPATSPRLLIELAEPLAPPSVGSAIMTPFCHTKGRHAVCEGKPVDIEAAKVFSHWPPKSRLDLRPATFVNAKSRAVWSSESRRAEISDPSLVPEDGLHSAAGGGRSSSDQAIISNDVWRARRRAYHPEVGDVIVFWRLCHASAASRLPAAIENQNWFPYAPLFQIGVDPPPNYYRRGGIIQPNRQMRARHEHAAARLQRGRLGRGSPVMRGNHVHSQSSPSRFVGKGLPRTVTAPSTFRARSLFRDLAVRRGGNSDTFLLAKQVTSPAIQMSASRPKPRSASRFLSSADK